MPSTIARAPAPTPLSLSAATHPDDDADQAERWRTCRRSAEAAEAHRRMLSFLTWAVALGYALFFLAAFALLQA